MSKKHNCLLQQNCQRFQRNDKSNKKGFKKNAMKIHRTARSLSPPSVTSNINHQNQRDQGDAYCERYILLHGVYIEK